MNAIAILIGKVDIHTTYRHQSGPDGSDHDWLYMTE